MPRHPIFAKKRDYLNFIFRLYAFGKIEKEDYYREAGKYFGYPRCCIENFVGMCKTGAKPARDMGKMFDVEFPALRGYIACPICRVSAFFTKAAPKLVAPHPAKNHIFYPEARDKVVKFIYINE